MKEIKYNVNPKHWSSVISTMNILKSWTQVTYKELEEDGDKFIIIQFPDDNDLQEAFDIGVLIAYAEHKEIR